MAMSRRLSCTGMGEVSESPADHDDLRRGDGARRLRLGSVAALAAAVAGGADRRFALRELLDDLAVVSPAGGTSLPRMWSEEPASTGDAGFDAFLAGLTEHLALQAGLEPPAWVEHPDRFLATFWFPHARADFDAIALRDSPGPFRRRNVYVHPSSLERV